MEVYGGFSTIKEQRRKYLEIEVEHANEDFDGDTIPATQQFKTRST